VVVVAVASVTVKFVVTDVPVVEPFTGELMLTAGLIESTKKLTDALPEPAALVATTVTVWLPCERLLYACGLVHAVAAAASSWQVMLVGELVAVKATEAFVVLRIAPALGEVMLTTGSAATVKVVDAEPMLPAASVAVTTIV
jgi:hypothetical protein